MSINVVLGLQYGDEGKAKIFHSLLEDSDSEEKYAIRWNGGPNAGHTVSHNGKMYYFHQVPAGVIVDNCVSIITSGVAFCPTQFDKEMKEYAGTNTCLVDNKCPVILPMFVDRDKEFYQKNIGTTAKGVGPTFSSFTARDAVLVEDLLDREILRTKIDRLVGVLAIDITKSQIKRTVSELNSWAIKNKSSFCNTRTLIKYLVQNHDDKYISFEGSQGYSLDLYAGDYPFVTSSGTTLSYLLWTTGISPKTEMDVIGVMKPYVTYVGEKEWPDEFGEEESEEIRIAGNEYGVTTGRPRRCGSVNFKEIEDAVYANGCTSIALTKTDLIEDSLGCSVYSFIEELKDKTGLDVNIISDGPGSDEWRYNVLGDMIMKENILDELGLTSYREKFEKKKKERMVIKTY